MQPPETAETSASGGAKQWVWFVALWLAGVSTLAIVAALLRLILL